MKRLWSTLVVFVSVFGLLSSCNEENKFSPQVKLKKVVYVDGLSSQNGIPMYHDWSQFYKHINEGITTDKLSAFEKKYSFQSLLGEFLKSANDPTYQETSSLIHKTDKWNEINVMNYGIASLINKDGFAIVGAGIYKFKGNEVFSLPLGGINIDKAQVMLNAESPKTVDPNIQVSTFKSHPIDQLRVFNQGNYQTSTTWLANQYNTFYMFPIVSWGTITYNYYECQGGMVYDEDAREYVCSSEVVYTGSSTSCAFIVQNRISHTHCPPLTPGCTYGYADQSWIYSNQASGYFDYQFEGNSGRITFNRSSNNYLLYEALFFENRPGTSIDFDVFGGSVRFDCSLTPGSFDKTIDF